MKNPLYVLILLILFFNCKSKEELEAISNLNNPEVIDSTKLQVNEFAIVIHGGAGTILKKNMTAEDEAAYEAKLEEAIRVGHKILSDGGSSLDAVEKTINILEDSPLFNAGKGAVFTNAETNELDASIMDGKTLNAGASAGTKTVKNPINLARAIMENSPHVMLSGLGAEKFAQEQGITIVDSSYFFTENRFNGLKRVKEREEKAPSDRASKEETDNKSAFYDTAIKDSKFGTVGCVALDKNGNLAAGTSTGGMTNKRWGRIGDAPIIGAGTYANNNTCAVSSTGWGEFFIRAMVAHDISALMDYKGLTLQEAAREVIQKKVPELGGDGGIIAVDKFGNLVMEFNTAGMYRASMNDKGELTIGIYKDNEN
ncbi:MULTISPECIES: isoaspartyl peptidase/L-asparaginase family protein [Bizionia]|uniref:Isoaspartyl peptidase n=1 Tax=Bizionia algoritergicola TaxID=291187 RepID=A0A5D0R340_9FLAO|nr:MULTISPECIES: isoaspartyl peptidase/L-asparaginase [Bizionia]OBX24308.1 beta-aspartyl-peptidase [Bizionia sp. APA-3]TYB75231.1 isoaspartyl peptidase/L-asparaginase [Bizionia algoritergicola]